MDFGNTKPGLLDFLKKKVLGTTNVNRSSPTNRYTLLGFPREMTTEKPARISENKINPGDQSLSVYYFTAGKSNRPLAAN